MPTYAVRVKGTGCRVKALVRDRQSSLKLLHQTRGFFATRVVDASYSDEAGRLVVAMLREELNDLIVNTPDEPWSLMIEAIEPSSVEWDTDTPAPRMTWFEESTPRSLGLRSAYRSAPPIRRAPSPPGSSMPRDGWRP